MEHCFYCSAPASTRDHVLPVSRGGSDCGANLVPCCGKCNQAKANLLPCDLEWHVSHRRRAIGLRVVLALALRWQFGLQSPPELLAIRGDMARELRKHLEAKPELTPEEQRALVERAAARRDARRARQLARAPQRRPADRWRSQSEAMEAWRLT